MARHIEPLHRGLVTARDPSLLNEGELQYTRNVRYRVGSPALIRAESRSLVGGGYNFTAPTPAIGIAWDDGPPQIIYKRPSGALRWVPANADPAAPVMADSASNAVAVADVPAGTLLLGAETVQFEGEHYVLDGTALRKITLSADLTPTFSMLGMPRNDGPLQLGYASSSFAIPDTNAIVPGWHHYWFTWYDGNEREGTSSVDAVGRCKVPSTQDTLVAFMYQSTFNAIRPSWATHVRVYRSPPQAEELPTPWPTGYMVREAAIADLAVRYGWQLDGGGFIYGLPVYGFEGEVVPNGSYIVLVDDRKTYPAVEEGVTPYEFPKASFTIDGEPIPVGRNGYPPRASTGDVFEESLLTNDIDDKRKVRFSLSGEFDKFPAFYYINLDTRDRDEVLSIRSLGRQAGVFMRGSVWCINWLPRSGDSEFGRGRVKELVVDGFGVVGRNLVDSFSLQRPLLAWYAPQGPCATDLVEWFELAPQINWRAIDGSPIALRNNIEKQRLEVYFVNRAGTGFIYYLHYHASQVEGGRLPVTGPITPRDDLRGVTTIQLGARAQHVSLDSRGNLYYESVGEAGVEGAFRTRDIYPVGAGGEVKVTSVYVHGTAPDGFWELYANPGRGSGIGSSELRNIDSSYGKLDAAAVDANGEFLQLGFASSSEFEVNWMGFEFENLGEAER